MVPPTEPDLSIINSRIAIALGWEYVPRSEMEGQGGFWITPAGERSPTSPPNYVTDWGASGPLIEEYVDGLYQRQWWWIAEPSGYFAPPRPVGVGPKPLVAVAMLLLSLAERGKLIRLRQDSGSGGDGGDEGGRKE